MTLKTVETNVPEHKPECKLHMGTSNVTFQESNFELKYGNQSQEKQHNLPQLFDTDNDYVDFIDLLKQEDCKNLIASSIPSTFDEKSANELKYDPGIYVPYPEEKPIEIGRRVIELTEQSFSILNLSGIAEYFGKTKDRKLETICSAAQTVHNYMTDVEWQTDLVTAVVGTQCHGYDILDAFGGAAGKRTLARNALDGGLLGTGPALVQHRSAHSGNSIADGWPDGDMPPPQTPTLEYCFAMDPMATGRPAAAVSCVHWNPKEIHMMAIGYGEPANAVAVWTMKNPHAPERFYDFADTTTITCVRFSDETPRYLAVGFEFGDLTVIDISSKNLEIIARLSNPLSIESLNVVDMFWTTQIDVFCELDQCEFLVKCGWNGHVILRCSKSDDFTIMKLFDYDMSMEAEQDSGVSGNESIRSVTKIIELNQNTYVVGTDDGWVYSCRYCNQFKYSTKNKAHIGPIKSLEKSPYSSDVFLTTGYDCSINIWVGDFFTKPVITLLAERPIEKAIWSRTSSTIIVSINDVCCVHVWDISAAVLEPTAVWQLWHPGNPCAAAVMLQFSPDGKYLCVSGDGGGKVDVYAWSDVTPQPSAAATDAGCQRTRLIGLTADALRHQPRLYKTLCRERPEHADAFPKPEPRGPRTTDDGDRRSSTRSAVSQASAATAPPPS